VTTTELEGVGNRHWDKLDAAVKD